MYPLSARPVRPGDQLSVLAPNSLFVQYLAIGAFAAVVVFAVWGWRRFRPRTASRVGVVLVAQCLVVVSIAIYYNRTDQIAATWDALAGSQQGLNPAVVVQRDGSASFGSSAFAQDRWNVSAADRLTDSQSAYRSTLVTTTIAGPQTGYNLPAQVYLPGSYADPASTTRQYPVIELLAGYPGSYLSWTYGMHLKATLDSLIAEKKMPAVIVVMPSQNPNPPSDSECVNASFAHPSSMAETYLTRDVPAYIAATYRSAPGRINWVIGGYSTGGYCAANLALRHPQVYASAMVLSGYFIGVHEHGPHQLFANRKDLRANSPQLTICEPRPKVAIFTIAAKDNKEDISAQARFIRKVPKYDALMAMTTETGGHTPVVWRIGSRHAFVWLARVLGPGVSAR
ncbi:putative esterase [Antricoccus suffuscus]|uniref:Putative esterase n=1 Tax=Antricoccus suffuscus TaxID=1629062 RepID=A0A2T0ZZ91_9ACTN|nr:alpha/beta hydrolase-fold protein [Antricoccus suffuscus]PRZ41679.1 putative esterase [Antricoccus suffuscus]